MIINATHIGKKLDGIGRFSLKIAKYFIGKHKVIINENAVIHFNNDELKKLTVVNGNISPDYGFKGHLKRLIFTNTLKGNILNLSQLEVSFWNKNQVVVVHDIIPLLFPEYHKKQYHFFKYVLPYVLRNRAKIIIAVSNHTKHLLVDIFHIHASKIEVVYNGVDLHYEKDLKKEDVIFFIGRNSPTKNIDMIIKSFKELKKEKRFDNFKLVLGGVGNLTVKDKDISVKSYLSDEELKVYYKKAKVFLFPTLYEGFGFPAIEAMRAKTACIVSNRGSLPEIVGDSALIVDPLNLEEIVEKLKKLLLDDRLREELELKGFKQSLQFNWKNSLQEYERVINENSIDS